jgi:hypothetical protein
MLQPLQAFPIQYSLSILAPNCSAVSTLDEASVQVERWSLTLSSGTSTTLSLPHKLGLAFQPFSFFSLLFGSHRMAPLTHCMR